MVVTLFTNVFGQPGTGKTVFAFTHPAPIFYARFDRRADAIIDRVKKDLGNEAVIEEAFIPHPLENRSEQNAEFLAKFEALIKKALKAEEGTFVIDGGNRLWDMVQDVKLPDLNTITDPKERAGMEKRRRLLYGSANEYLHGILLGLEDSPLQVVITHHTRSVYDDQGKETEYVRPDYFKRVPYTATVEVFLVTTQKERVHVPSVKALTLQATQQGQAVLDEPPKFWGLITECKFDKNLVSKMYPNLTFKYLYGLCAGSSWKGGPTWDLS